MTANFTWKINNNDHIANKDVFITYIPHFGKRALVKCDTNLGQTRLGVVIFKFFNVIITYFKKYIFQIFYRVKLLI